MQRGPASEVTRFGHSDRTETPRAVRAPPPTRRFTSPENFPELGALESMKMERLWGAAKIREDFRSAKSGAASKRSAGQRWRRRESNPGPRGIQPAFVHVRSRIAQAAGFVDSASDLAPENLSLAVGSTDEAQL